MPAEWFPHECCWMQWPYETPNHDGYGSVPSWSHFDFKNGRAAWSNVGKAIAKKNGPKQCNYSEPSIRMMDSFPA